MTGVLPEATLAGWVWIGLVTDSSATWGAAFRSASALLSALVSIRDMGGDAPEDSADVATAVAGLCATVAMLMESLEPEATSAVIFDCGAFGRTAAVIGPSTTTDGVAAALGFICGASLVCDVFDTFRAGGTADSAPVVLAWLPEGAAGVCAGCGCARLVLPASPSSGAKIDPAPAVAALGTDASADFNARLGERGDCWIAPDTMGVESGETGGVSAGNAAGADARLEATASVSKVACTGRLIFDREKSAV